VDLVWDEWVDDGARFSIDENLMLMVVLRMM